MGEGRMKRSYRVGAHRIKLITKPEMKGSLCGEARWESKEVELRLTNVDDGKVYDMPSFLVIFFHEWFHMVDSMQGTELFGDKDPELDYQKETMLDSFCEGFVQFMVDNHMLREGWMKGVKELLKKTKALQRTGEGGDGIETSAGE
jgi:hypothetical protein